MLCGFNKINACIAGTAFATCRHFVSVGWSSISPQVSQGNLWVVLALAERRTWMDVVRLLLQAIESSSKSEWPGALFCPLVKLECIPPLVVLVLSLGNNYFDILCMWCHCVWSKMPLFQFYSWISDLQHLLQNEGDASWCRLLPDRWLVSRRCIFEITTRAIQSLDLVLLGVLLSQKKWIDAFLYPGDFSPETYASSC